MPHDPALAARVRRALAAHPGVTERSMFGGLAFLLGGKMACGVLDDRLVVRVGPAAYEEALARPHVRPMDFTGRPLTGYIYVDAAGCRTARAVAAWVARATAFVATLAPTRRRPRRAPARRGVRRTRRRTGRRAGRSPDRAPAA